MSNSLLLAWWSSLIFDGDLIGRPAGSSSDVASWFPTMRTDSGFFGGMSVEGGFLVFSALLCFRRVGFRCFFLKLFFEIVEAFFGAVVQEAEIPEFLKAFGQNMLQEPLHEIQGRQGHGCPGLVALLIAILIQIKF